MASTPKSGSRAGSQGAYRPRRPITRRPLTQDAGRGLLAVAMVMTGLVAITRPAQPNVAADVSSALTRPSSMPASTALYSARAAAPAPKVDARAAQKAAAAKAAKARVARASRTVRPTWGRVTAGFGSHSRLWSSGRHTGVDFRVPVGTPVRAFKQGTVVSAGWDGAYGRKIVIRHASGARTVYAHLSKIQVKVGQKVQAGQRIARSGRSGNTTGPHVHFEVIKNGKKVNPMPYLRGKRL